MQHARPREDEKGSGHTKLPGVSRSGSAPSTVKNQISSILGMMDVAERIELAARASRMHGISGGSDPSR